jgi:hypothetical protein
MRRMPELLREPVVHFLVIGAVIFGLFGLTIDPVDTQAKRVVVSEGDVERLAARFARTWMRPPTEAEPGGLVDAHVREEIYYREALGLGLDRDDPLVRQRMRQKLEFLLEDLNAGADPSDADLQRFLDEHAERFALPARISFQQVYLNPDRHSDLDAATSALAQALDTGAAAADLGDRVMLGHTFESVTPEEIARLFGGAFAQSVSALEPGGWIGPVDSGVGRHFVRVSDRQAGRLPQLDAARELVAAEWQARHTREQKEATYQRLREGYEVIIEPFDIPDPAASATGGTGG